MLYFWNLTKHDVLFTKNGRLTVFLEQIQNKQDRQVAISLNLIFVITTFFVPLSP